MVRSHGEVSGGFNPPRLCKIATYSPSRILPCIPLHYYNPEKRQFLLHKSHLKSANVTGTPNQLLRVKGLFLEGNYIYIYIFTLIVPTNALT